MVKFNSALKQTFAVSSEINVTVFGLCTMSKNMKSAEYLQCDNLNSALIKNVPNVLHLQ